MLKTRCRRRAHPRRQIRVARACGLERARVHDHRPAVALHQLVGEPGCALDARRRLEPAQQPSVPSAKLAEPGNLCGRSPRTIFHTGAENVSWGALLMNGAADSQHHGSQTPDQTQEETQKKALGAHAYGTGETPTEVRDNRREGGLSPPSPPPLYEAAIPMKVRRRRRDFHR